MTRLNISILLFWASFLLTKAEIKNNMLFSNDIYYYDNIQAQTKLKFSVVEFAEDQFDLSARDKQYEKIDGSGARYAIIKVTSDNPNDDLREYKFNFGQLRHETVMHDNTLWLYVQKNAKQVSISREGYATIDKYDLRTTIEAGKNYVMVLSSEVPKKHAQMLMFSIKPADAHAVVMYKNVLDEGREQLLGTTDEIGGLAKSLPYGTYSYSIVSEYFHPTDGSITLNDRNKTHIEEVTLRPNFSEVTLSVGANADIYINNEKKGSGTWTGRMKMGEYQVECRLKNNRSTKQNITIPDNDKHSFTLAVPTPITGTLSIISSPLGADIKIDGKDYGTTPKNVDVIIGQHTLTLSMPRYNTMETSVEVIEDETMEVSENLIIQNDTNEIFSSPARLKTIKPVQVGTQEAVDLGLSVKWATCNVGANSPEEYGNYFAWGETQSKSNYTESNSSTYGRRTYQLKSAGIVESNGNLTSTYDVASVIWGGTWRMPTSYEVQELVENCNSTWTTQNGVFGRKMTSKKNGNSIFLPAAGYRRASVTDSEGVGGYYWTKTPWTDNGIDAYGLGFNSDFVNWIHNYRYYGRTIRPVSE